MPVFTGLAIVMALAATGAFVARLLKQPLLLGYAIVGGLLSLSGFAAQPQIKELLQFSGQIGVTLLLFLVGLELPVTDLKHVGKNVIIAGVGQVVITMLLGLGVSYLLGWDIVSGSFIGLGLAFSSTIVVIKILTEKKDLSSLYGKLTIGFLIIQDFIAIGVLVFLSGTSNLPMTIIKGIALIFVSTWVSSKILPKITIWLGKSPEMLFIGAIGWCLGIAAIVSSPVIGFSVELGGFLAGLALAQSSQHLQISSRVKPLRDFFLTLFFVSLGASVTLGQWSTIWVSVLVLSGFVLFVKPLITMLILKILGYSHRVSFMSAVSLSQISEFSLLLAALTNSHLLALMAMVGLITMVASNYLVVYSNKIFRFFKFKKSHNELTNNELLTNHIVLIGHNRVGNLLRPVLQGLERQLVVVDFDPAVIEELKDEENLKVIYGDMADEDLYEELNLKKAELIVSTVPDCEDNLLLLEYLKRDKTPPITVLLASNSLDAETLYKSGADLVVVPHSVGGEYLASVLAKHGLDREHIRKMR
ncbi:MAG: cation:proton antiporter family protein [Patescibacteria group bacterium]